MSDKKEVTELSIKISVDTTDLDKLEAQLNRIKGLLSNIGTKKTNSVGFDVMPFVFIEPTQFINSCFINKVALASTSDACSALQRIEELSRACSDSKKALAEQVRQISIDALRNSSGFA
ncbi:hypothetical protein ABN242_03190 [Providencia alcalifaciens]|uniref:hypothetical protein n=1 Tax=Providencia alcalifaciens TaxID=126385 RepID=UPI0032DA8156